MTVPISDLDRRIWAWLPARADRGRVTLPAVIAESVAAPVAAVAGALAAMERAGHVVRDRPTGRRAQSWHRGRALPPRPAPSATEQAVPLWY